MKVSATVQTAQTGTLENRRQFFSHAGIVMFGALTAGTMVGSREALAGYGTWTKTGSRVRAWTWIKIGAGVTIVIIGGFVYATPGIAPKYIGVVIVAYGIMGPIKDGLKELNDTLLDDLEKKVMEF